MKRIALFAALATLIFAGLAAHAEPINGADIYVIDGDTVQIMQRQPNVRLVGFNAPETYRAACAAERQLGNRATRRLRELVRSEPLDFEFVACSCRPGTEGTDQCNFRRRCGTLKAGGRDVGEILVVEKLAVSFTCGKYGCPSIPRPWCEGASHER